MSGVQFVEPKTNLKFALTSTTNATSHENDLHMQIQVPSKYGWGSVALGDQMTGALMFVVYPSTSGTGATLSIRTASGEEQPTHMLGVDCSAQSLQMKDSIIDAAFTCYNIAGDSRLTSAPSSTRWIWAVGPGGQHPTGANRDSESVALAMHNYYGLFTLDMTKARVAAPAAAAPAAPSHTVPSRPAGTAGPHLTTTRTQTVLYTHRTTSTLFGTHLPEGTSNPMIPAITGNASTGSSALSSAGPNTNLIHAHAVFLGFAFLILFPLGIIRLRLKSSVRLHWITQTTASGIAFLGFIMALALSAQSEEYKGCGTTHQVLGILSSVGLIPQILLGVFHHRGYNKGKAGGRGGWMASSHRALGRIIMTLGLIAGITGYTLHGNKTGAIVFAVFAVLVVGAVVAVVVWTRWKADKASLPFGKAAGSPVSKAHPFGGTATDLPSKTSPWLSKDAANNVSLPGKAKARTSGFGLGLLGLGGSKDSTVTADKRTTRHMEPPPGLIEEYQKLQKPLPAYYAKPEQKHEDEEKHGAGQAKGGLYFI